MKRRLLIFMLLLGFCGSAQDFQPYQDKLFNGQVKFYPLSALAGIKAEVGFGLPNKWQINAMGTYYYRYFYLYSKSKALHPSIFYEPTDGFGAFLSLEKTLNNEFFSIGGRIGTKQLSSSEFDVTGELPESGDEEQEFLKISNQNYYLLFISRLRSAQQGFFVEFVAQAGMVYIIRREETRGIYTGMQTQYADQSTTSILPHISIGFNVGLGW
jgi:hypothetical protein